MKWAMVMDLEGSAGGSNRRRMLKRLRGVEELMAAITSLKLAVVIGHSWNM